MRIDLCSLLFAVFLKFFENVSLMEFMYLVFTRMSGDRYRRLLGILLLCVFDIFLGSLTSIVVDLKQKISC